MVQAPRVLVISPQKSGTHLMQGLMSKLGYKMAGVPRPTPDNTPRFDAEQLKAIAALTMSRSDLADFLQLEGNAAFEDRGQEAWAALGWNWQRRLGQRVVNRYGQTRYDFSDQAITNPHVNYTKFADTPRRLCWIFHELDLERVDGGFLGEWVQTGEPPIVLNYRDPRDTLVSMINFLEGRTRAGYGNFYEYDVFSRILASKPTWSEKLDYAMRDPAFPGKREFETSLWLLHDPNVCKVRYEDLAGPEGGGSRERQVDALQRLLRHVDADRDPERVGDTVYDRDSWSFYRGKSGAWREVFSDANQRRFHMQFGDVLEQYGYA